MKKISIALAASAVLFGAFATTSVNASAATSSVATTAATTTLTQINAFRVTELWEQNVVTSYGVKANNAAIGVLLQNKYNAVTAATTQLSFQIKSTNLGWGTASQIQMRNMKTGATIKPTIGSDNVVTFDTTGFFASGQGYSYQVELNLGDGFYFGIFQPYAY